MLTPKTVYIKVRPLPISVKDNFRLARVIHPRQSGGCKADIPGFDKYPGRTETDLSEKGIGREITVEGESPPRNHTRHRPDCLETAALPKRGLGRSNQADRIADNPVNRFLERNRSRWYPVQRLHDEAALGRAVPCAFLLGDFFGVNQIDHSLTSLLGRLVRNTIQRCVDGPAFCRTVENADLL
jgi:hypothetical protein